MLTNKNGKNLKDEGYEFGKAQRSIFLEVSLQKNLQEKQGVKLRMAYINQNYKSVKILVK